MKKSNTRTLIANAVKSVVAYIITAIFTYIVYFFMLNAENMINPATASGRTVSFSIIMLFVSVFIFTKIFSLPTHDPRKVDEKTNICEKNVLSNYNLDYKKYFTDQVKTRLWSVAATVLVLQIPLIINYAVTSFAEDFNVFSSPISIYKFYTPFLFMYEILGKAWFLAPIAVTAIFFAAFCVALYFEQKKWIDPKPSWME